DAGLHRADEPPEAARRRSFEALPVTLGSANQPPHGFRPAALHQARESRATGRHRHTDELLLTAVGILGQPRKPVAVALLLAPGVGVPIHAGSLTRPPRPPDWGRLVNGRSTTIVIAVDAPGSPSPQTGSRCLT